MLHAYICQETNNVVKIARVVELCTRLRDPVKVTTFSGLMSAVSCETDEVTFEYCLNPVLTLLHTLELIWQRQLIALNAKFRVPL